MPDKNLKILILGGYGTFGGRCAVLLARNPAIDLVIAGRSLDKAQRFAATLPRATAHAVDRDANLETAIRSIEPDIVVDATGPFQTYGGDPYRVVRGSLAAKANYLDLADGSGFVEGISAFDAEARAKGLFVLSGVSSFPVLTAAAVRALSDDLDGITVRGGIAPSPFAGVGINVIRAITGYAGQPIRLVRDGNETTSHALTESMRYTIAPPGAMPLRNTRFSLVDVPDLLMIPRAIPRIRSLWMGAGPVPEILHRALNALAWFVRLRLVPTLAPLASLCSWAINTLRWGEHRGGMFVEVTGRTAAGESVHRSWHLLAEGSDGPLIPSMAIEAVVLKLLDGNGPPPGARAATDALELADYDRVFAGRTIVTGRRDDTPTDRPLYRDILGDAWDRLPPTLRKMHTLSDTLIASGRATVEIGRGPFAALLRRLMRFPPAGADVSVTVSFTARDSAETWTRTFAGHVFHSTQQRGSGRSDRLLVERFGPIAAGIALVLDDEKLRLVIRRWSILGIPLPLALAPRGDTYEFEQDGCFHFHVEIAVPLVGRIVKYTGWLELQPGSAAAARSKNGTNTPGRNATAP